MFFYWGYNIHFWTLYIIIIETVTTNFGPVYPTVVPDESKQFYCPSFRFRTNREAAKRQDSFHYEGKRPRGNTNCNENGNGALSLPDQQHRRHSTGHINIAALQPNLENLKLQQNVSVVKLLLLLGACNATS